MSTIIRINSEESKLDAIQQVCGIDPGKGFTVEILDKKDAMSSGQRRLYWKRLGIIADHTGDTPMELHEQYKYKFLSKILMEDNGKFKAMAALVKSMSGNQDVQVIRDGIVDLLSITTLTPHQMSEYMDAIESHASTFLDVALPSGDDK